MKSYDIIFMFMKRKLIIFCLAFSLLGCGQKDSNKNLIYENYRGYYEAIEENTRFNDSSLYFSLDGQMSKMPDGTYRYYLFLENPQIAMYDVVFLAVENNIPFENADKMMPSIGIFESQDYNLIPFQSNTERGFVKGLVISGESATNSIELKILVEWADKTHEKFTREYYFYTLDETSFTPVTIAGPRGS